MKTSCSPRIESPSNPRVKTVVQLRQRARRDAMGLTVIEGFREVRCALEYHHPIQDLYVCPEFFLGKHEGDLITRAETAGTRVFHCSQRAFRKMSYRDRPDGLLALAPQVRHMLEKLPLGSRAVFLVAESIEKPGNLGTILRSADAAGADGVIVCDPATDLNNPNVVRASIGTLFHVPVAEADVNNTLAWLRNHRVKVVAASPHATLDYTALRMPDRVALVVGSEQYGLSQPWMENADHLVKIPMLGHADSLNVASAATLLLYEAVRQRT